jgi:putative flippase GtrA
MSRKAVFAAIIKDFAGLLFDLEKIFRYGVMALIVGSFYFFLIYFMKNIAGRSDFWAVAIAYPPSVALHFVINKYYVFRARGTDGLKGEIVKYLITGLLNYAVILATTKILLFLGVNVYLCAAAGIAVSALNSYLCMGRFVFKKHVSAG